MKIAIACLLVFSALCALRADEIVFKNGKKIEGTVVEYKNGRIKIRRADGEEISGDIEKIDSIKFDLKDAQPKPDEKKEITSGKKTGNGYKPDEDRSKEQENATTGMSGPELVNQKKIQKQLDEIISQTEKKLKPDQAAFVIYIDAEEPLQIPKQTRIEYKCFHGGGGYSGSRSVPFRQAAAQIETMRNSSDDGLRRIEIDPGPPYEAFSIAGELEPGKVTNLGRVFLKEVIASGTVAIQGIVTSEDGNPVKDAIVTGGKLSVKSDADGRYIMEGFGLENVQLKVSKGILFGEPDFTTKVPIRNTDERMITKNLKLLHPKQMKLKYVISATDSESVVGPESESGTIAMALNSAWSPPLKEKSRGRFHTFVTEFGGNIWFSGDAWRIRNFMAPMYYGEASAGKSFESIDRVNETDAKSQFCPPLKEGKVILIRGFSKVGTKGVSQYCAKILVEEFRDQ